MKKTFVAALLILFLLLSFAPVFAQGLPQGEEAPDFSLTDTDGNKVSLTDFSGKVVILHFWHAN